MQVVVVELGFVFGFVHHTGDGGDNTNTHRMCRNWRRGIWRTGMEREVYIYLYIIYYKSLFDYNEIYYKTREVVKYMIHWKKSNY